MLAISTSWQSGGTATAEEMLAAFKNLDISAIELSYRISASLYQEMKKPLQRSGLKVVSVHNYFPIPAVRSNARGSGDLFCLSSRDDEERRNAIRFTVKTIEHAANLGAAAVVLHCGAVAMDPEMHLLYQFYKADQIDSAQAQAFIRSKLKERDRLKPPHMDRLLASLDQLVSAAAKQGVGLGLENRYHYHELPGIDDFRLIFDRFKGAPIGYWHDTGHAHANETLGLIPQQSLLPCYKKELIGIHIHDAVGLDDHIPPGAGDIDFAALIPFLGAATIHVIELKPGIPVPQAQAGIRCIRKLLSGS